MAERKVICIEADSCAIRKEDCPHKDKHEEMYFACRNMYCSRAGVYAGCLGVDVMKRRREDAKRTNSRVDRVR